MDPADRLGVLGIAVAICGWGSYAVPMKMSAVSLANVDPLVYQLYMSAGIACSSQLLLLLPDESIHHWTWWAALAAFLWVQASVLTITVVRSVGIAVGQSVWSGTNALVSFLWGQLYFRAGMRSPLLGAVGQATLLSGIGCVGWASVRVGKSNSPLAQGAETLLPLAEPLLSTPFSEPLLLAPLSEPLLLRASLSEQLLRAPPQLLGRSLALGLALVVGILGGCSHAAFRAAPPLPFRDGIHALGFVRCQGVATLCTTAVFFVLRSAVRGRTPPMHARTCLLPAFASGVLWNIGNAGAVLAMVPTCELS